MIKGEIIQELVSLFAQRQVVLFHACQLIDFQSYIKVGGIPSRDTLEKRNLLFTAFDTDSTDRNNGVWDKVFVNLLDFGETFAKGKAGLPNPYGPILLYIDPVALLEASDVAISLRSAGAKDFNRQKESLKTIQEVDRVFLNPQDSPYPQCTYVKYKKGLIQEFNLPHSQSPEISITVNDGKLPLKYIIKVKTDPYKINEKTLEQFVKDCIIDGEHSFKVETRVCESTRYSELAQFVMDPEVNLLNISKTSLILKEWAEKALQYGLEWQYKRFSTYLRKGTFEPLQ